MKTIRLKNMQKSAEITLAEVERPTITHPSEAVVRVLCVGLDGTDQDILFHHFGTPPLGESDLTIGHESLGVVEEAGEASGLAPGDLVTALVRRPCKDLSCVNCRNGHSDFCETGTYTERGIKEAHGYLSEFYKEEARYLIKMPSECLEYGVLAEPQSVVEKVWDEVLKIQQRHIWEPTTVLILGSGPLGILAALTFRTMGLDVYVWSRSEDDSPSARLIRACGAHFQHAGTAETPVFATHAASSARCESLTEYAKQCSKRFGLILECTGYSPLVFEAMTILSPNGILALLGIYMGDNKLEIPSDSIGLNIVLNNKCILGSVNSSRKNFETGIYRLKQMSIKYPEVLKGIISDRISLDDVPQIDFKKVTVKAVVDIVSRPEWQILVKMTSNLEYSFSV